MCRTSRQSMLSDANIFSWDHDRLEMIDRWLETGGW